MTQLLRRRLFHITLCSLLLTGFGAKEIQALPITTVYSPSEGIVFYTDDDLFDVKLSAWGQFRATYLDRPPDEGLKIFSWGMKRLRLGLGGKILHRSVKFKVEFDLAGSPTAKDMWISYKFGSFSPFKVTVGQFKVPYNRSELTSDSKGQMVDRALANEEMGLSRDVGLGLNWVWNPHVSGRYLDRILSCDLAFCNGNGSNKSANDGQEQLYIARVMVSPFGYVEFDEPARFPDSKFLVALGGSYYMNKKTIESGTSLDNTGLVADVAIRWYGLSINSEYLERTKEQVEGGSSGATSGAQFKTTGYTLQGGYFFPFTTSTRYRDTYRSGVEITARYGQVDFEFDEGFFAQFDQRKNEIEYGGGINYYFDQHRIKFTTDYLVYKKEYAADNITGQTSINRQARLQLQFML